MNEIGILALQGGFELHAGVLRQMGVTPRFLKKPHQLDGITGLIIPGGESSVLLNLLSKDFRSAIIKRINEGLPLFATCAGLILIADVVENPSQESLALLPVTVFRNAYGRQIDSVILKDIPLIDHERETVAEAVFIRAPRIIQVANTVSVMARRDSDPILVRYKNIVAATFHPELSEDCPMIYRAAFPQLMN